MGDSKKGRGGTLIVVAVAVLLALGLIEGALRLTFDQSRLYRGIAAYPDLARRHHELQFVEGLRGGAPNPAAFDPELGWDIGGDRIRHHAVGPRTESPTHRIVAIGDSFTFGGDVGENQTYSRFLEQSLCGVEVLNMGVGGYGIDQAVLKYLKHGKSHRPNVIVLGIHVPNYERASLSFFSASKPVFRRSPEDGAIRLANHPVPPPAAEVERIRREAKGEVYTWALARMRFLYLARRISGNADFFEEMDRIVEHVLLLLVEEAKAADARILVLQIPLGPAFLRESAWHRAMSEHLLSVYRKMGLRYVDLAEAWRSRMAAEDIVRTYYIQGAGYVGHLSEAGNRAAAAEIAEVLKEWGFPARDACPG